MLYAHRSLALAAALALPTAVCAQAAPGVVIYGSLDASVAYIDNVGGKTLKRVDTGSLYANRWGLRGSEDLGGGLAAVFVLEGGFNVDDGTTTLGSRTFGRQSYVGLSDKRWGTLTLGRQYDFLYAGSPLPLDVGALLIGGLAGASGGAGTGVDNHSGGVRYDNSVKWQHRFGAWTAGAMYSFGNENNTGRAWSAGAAYRSGPVWAGVGHVHDNFAAPAGGNRITIAGLNWDVMAGHKLIATLSTARADVVADRTSKTDMLQLGWLVTLQDLWTVGAMFGQADLRNAKGVDGTLRQYGLGAQYALSRRTTLYGIGSLVQASGSAGTAFSGVPGIGAPAATLRSNDDSQGVWRVGILHKF
ncbi:MAG: porin [Burkholderiales bacterium]|nr:porin [Burkholderiales bacterium]